MARTKLKTKKSKLKKKKGRKTRSVEATTQSHHSTRRAGGVKVKLTKRAIIDKLVTASEGALGRDGTSVMEKHSTSDTRKVVTAVLEGLEDIIQKSLQPGSCGEFMLPGMFKAIVKTRPAIRKGTMVRNPGTGEMQPSKGRPSSRSVKLRPLVKLKRAAAGDL